MTIPMSTERKTEIVEYMKTYPSLTYKEYAAIFNCSKNKIAKIRRQYSFDPKTVKQLSKERRDEIAEYIKNNPSESIKELCDRFACNLNQIGTIKKKNVLSRVRKYPSMTEEKALPILSYMRENPHIGYDVLSKMFPATIPQIRKLRECSDLPSMMESKIEYRKSLPTLNKEYRTYKKKIIRKIGDKSIKVHHLHDYLLAEDMFHRQYSQKRSSRTISKLIQNNSYVSPEVEEELIVYMSENSDADYPKIIKTFPNLERRYIQHMRKKHNLPPIKKKKPLTFQRMFELENQRFCRKCGELKDLSHWYPHTKSACIDCELNRGLLKHEKYMEQHTATIDTFLQYKLTESKKRTNLSGKNTLTFEELQEVYLRQDGRCFYSNRPLEAAVKNINSLSIDRIDSSKNYSKDNIVLCCKICNYMKQGETMQDFIDMCVDIGINQQHKESQVDYSI